MILVESCGLTKNKRSAHRNGRRKTHSQTGNIHNEKINSLYISTQAAIPLANES